MLDVLFAGCLCVEKPWNGRISVVQLWDFAFNALNFIHSIQNVCRILNTLHCASLSSSNWWTKKNMAWSINLSWLWIGPRCNCCFQYVLHQILVFPSSIKNLSQSFWACSKVLKIVASQKALSILSHLKLFASPYGWINFNSPKSCPHPFYWAATVQPN